MAEETKSAGKLGDTKKEDDEETLSGTLANVAFGLVGPSPLGAALGFGGAIAHAMRGTRPSHAAERSAMTGQLSNLEGLFDALEAAGLSRANPGSILGAVRPDISDPAVKGELEAAATHARQSEEAADADRRAAPTNPVSDIQGIGFSPARQDPTPGRDRGADGGAGGMSGSEQAQRDAGETGGAPGGTGDPGDNAGVGAAEGQAKGAAFLVTKKMLHGGDPKGPDTGSLKFTVQDGEMVMVFPRDMVSRYGPEKMKMFFEAWRAHFKKAPKGAMPKMQRKTAMG